MYFALSEFLCRRIYATRALLKVDATRNILYKTRVIIIIRIKYIVTTRSRMCNIAGVARGTYKKKKKKSRFPYLLHSVHDLLNNIIKKKRKKEISRRHITRTSLRQ